MKSLREYQEITGEAISKIKFPSQPADLYEPLNYFLSLGGKRMRPVLLLMSNEMFGGKAERVMPQALAYELFHNFTLIHDDIMDKAPLRRGVATVHTKWNENTGILSGDVLFVKSLQLLSECDEKIFPAIHHLFCKTATEVCEGQQSDMEFEKRNAVSIDEYIQMITLKTAVLLGACLKTGAMLAGANTSDANHIYEFGKNLGIAFQLKDDLLDVFGDQEKFGKQKGGDIITGKKTFLLLTALNDSDKKESEELQILIHNKNISDEEKVKSVIRIYTQKNIPQKTEEEMNGYFQKASEHLHKINLPAEKKKPLEKLAEQLMVRVN